MQISRKTFKGYGCPICNNKQLLIGYNDLKTLFPEVAKDWDFEENSTKPEDHIAGSHVRVYWKCSNCGHKWITGIKNRTYSETKCPNCHGKDNCSIKLFN